MAALRELAQKLDRQLRTPSEPPVDAPSRFHLLRGIALDDLRTRVDDLRSRAEDLWSRLAAALPRPRWLARREARIAAVAALAVVAIAGFGMAVWTLRSPEHDGVVPPIETAPAVRAPAEAVPKADVAAISKAMSDCDAAAAEDQDSLYFLIVPMVPASKADRSWAALALQTVGNSYILLSGKDALDGLADNTLLLRPARYTFAILDTVSGTTFAWTSATGLSRLTKRAAGDVKTLKLGFDFSEAQTGAQWSAEFQRARGTCYWVSALVRE